MTRNGQPAGRQGFTLTELLIVVSIMMILALLIFLTMKTQLAKGRDTTRKADLHRIQKAFEEYFNDYQCYPPEDILENCGSDDLAPYLREIPCEPTGGDPYLYVPGEPSQCSGYRICTRLEYKSDPDIARMGCDPENGCGFGAGYNYCVTVGYPATAEGFQINISPTVTLTPTPSYEGIYVCTLGGVCNITDDPALHGCPVSWADNCPVGACSNPANRCAN